MRRILMPVLLLLASLALFASAPVLAQDDASADATLEATEDADVAALLPLDAALAPLLDHRLFSTADVGLQVVDVETGDEVWAHRADDPLVPASVTKTLTTAVALRTLGPGYQFDTDALAGGELSAEGVLQGNLYIRGGGDPTLVVEQVWKIVRDLQSYGIAEVDGDIVFDDSFFSDPGEVPGWNKKVDQANGPAYFAPLSALSVNFNTTCLLVAPGSARGEPARVDVETPAIVVEVVNEVTTGSSRSRPWLKVERELINSGKQVVFTVSGSVPLDAETTRLYRSVGDPTVHFMAVFETLMKDRGLTWTGRLSLGETPSDAELIVRHRSAALGQVLAQMNKRSSNIMAEQVLKTVGAVAGESAGSTTAGVAVIADYFDELGIPRDEYHLVNGSGLSRDIRLRPSHATAVLVDLYHDKKVGPEFLSSLSVAGVDGTLRRRLRGETSGLVRGKTGSLNSVYCLAGYIHGGDGRVYAFAFMVNGFSGSARPVRDLQDRFAEALLALSDEVGHGSE